MLKPLAPALPRFSALGLLHRHQLIYNQCWEDPAVDRAALRLGADDRVLVITSAGCNALDYATTGARVVAVDANPRQTWLLELKLAAIRRLDHASAFELFGQGASLRARELYEALRPALSPRAAEFWDRQWPAFDARQARGGSFYYSGTSGLVALGLRAAIRTLGLRPLVERILRARDLDEQWWLYETGLRPGLCRPGLLRLLGRPGLLALLGVPVSQRQLVARHPGGIVGYLRACLDRVMSVALLRHNYFWRVYVTGSYDGGACPRYLEPEGFARLKAGLVDRVEAHTATVADFLAGDGRRFSAFVLLDHMDWMTGQPGLLLEEWRQILDHAAAGARVIFRSAGADAGFLPASVLERLAFAPETTRRLHALDRVGTYGSFHLARLAAA